jgi:TolB-like protein/DNA-binding winged helix-turn-helix (wHTH) protein
MQKPELAPLNGNPGRGSTPLVVLAREPSRRVGPLEIRPPLRMIAHADGRTEILDPKAMQVLVALLRADGAILTRDDLNASCWGRLVSEDALNRVLSRLRKTAGGIGKGVFRLETVKKVGFRLVTIDDTGTNAGLRQKRRRGAMGSAPALALVLIALLLASAWLLAVPRSQPTALAVLPFRSLTPGDQLFAEGFSEEVLGQLADQPRLRVMGRRSSAALTDSRLGAGAIGRRLGVDHVLEGTVRRSGQRVRVRVSLISTASGLHLWSGSYDGRLDDIIAIQERIGASVAGALEQKLVPAAARHKPDGAAQALYLVARGLMRERDPAKTAAAIDLLRRAREIDRRFAAIPASLGVAIHLHASETAGEAGRQSVRQQVLALEREALRLQPDLAEAHAAVAMINDFSGPEAARAIVRAVRLDPHSAENWLWLALLHDAKGDYARAYGAIRRAAAIDPLWERAYRQAAEFAWALGREEEAESYLRRVETARIHPHLVAIVRARLRADWSSAAARGIRALHSPSTEDANYVGFHLAWALWHLGRDDAAARLNPNFAALAQAARGPLPSRSQLIEQFRGERVGWRHTPYPFAMERLLLRAGRTGDLVALYDGLIASPQALARHPAGHQAFIEEAPSMAIALRSVGRNEEARRILDLADFAARQRVGSDAVPTWYLVDAARLWSVRGDSADAIAALETAVSRGWAYNDHAIFESLGDEPAFASLRDHPRFQSIVNRLTAHSRRERREAAHLNWP